MREMKRMESNCERYEKMYERSRFDSESIIERIPRIKTC